VLVRTKGKWAGGGDRSWLLIKHRDEWAGNVDITEFAPLSVKSKGDFADILAEGSPDIWISHRPAQGGEAGAMFEKIVKRALEMRGTPLPAGTAKTAVAKKTVARKTGVKKTATKRKSSSPARTRSAKGGR
jgi:hypothetical protein